MDIKMLRSILESSFEMDSFVLQISRLESSAIGSISGNYFPEDKLKLKISDPKNCIEESESGDYISVKGSGIDYPFNGLDVVAGFSMADDSAGLVMSASAGKGWRLKDALPLLEGTIIGRIEFGGASGPHITLLSHSTGSRQAGMHFDGIMDLSAMSAGFSMLLGLKELQIDGVVVIIENGSNFQSIDLDGPSIKGVNLGLASNCEVSFKMGCRLVHSFLDKDDVAIPYIGMTTTIPFEAQAKQYYLPVYVEVTNLGNPIRFTVGINDSIDAAVEELKALTAGVGFEGFLPDGFELQKYIRFDDLFFDYSLKDNKVSFISLAVMNASPWTILQHINGTNKDLTVQNIVMRLLVNDPFGAKNAAVSISGEISLGDGGVMCIYTRYPNWELGGYLKKGSILSVRDIVSCFVGTNDNVPDIKIGALDFKFSSGNYSLYTSLNDIWSITNGSSCVFAIDQVVLSIKYNKLEGANAKFSGELDIAGVTVSMEAEYSSLGGFKFNGSTGKDQEIPIGRLLEDIVHWFGEVSLPKVLNDLTIDDLSVSFDTGSKDFSFGCGINFPVSDTETAYLKVNISLTHQKDGSHEKKFSGKLNIGELLFDVEFDWSKDTSALVATYSSAQEASISINSLVANISQGFANILPSLEIGLKDVLFVWSKSGNASKFLFGIDISADINLSNIPLVGKEFPPEETVKINNLKVVLASAQLNSQEVDTINRMINIGWAKLPKASSQKTDSATSEVTDVAFESGATFAVDLQFGSKKELLLMNIGGADQLGKSTQTDKECSDSSALICAQTQSAYKAKWFKLQKSFGPVYFERIGVSYQDNCLWFLLDGSLTASSLTISLVGMSVGSRLSSFDPKFYLNGIDVDFKCPPLEIEGGFMAVDPLPEGVIFQYNGDAVLRTGKLSIAAIGSYAQIVSGQPSMFVFANLDTALGGPPYFFVNGLAAGFGYNRNLIIPPLEKLTEFPLVSLALGKCDKEKMLQEINKCMTVKVGEDWLAAGIRFNSFEMIDSFALLTASFGTRFELDLLGLSEINIPVNVSGSKDSANPIAHAQLALKAVFAPDDGLMAVSAALTSESYILSRDCKLIGGFAFYLWFAKEHAGDFVITLGGYHPAFKKPDHYPQVNRLGFNWKVDNNLTLKGGAYFALTPSCIMAGGELDASYINGNLKAWFRAYADFLIQWKPFHYDISIGASIGASYRVDCLFIHHTYTIELGASLHIWGPEFTGKAHISWFIISFTISFGSSDSAEPLPLSWSEFSSSFLPQAKDTTKKFTTNDGQVSPSSIVCTVSIQDGLLKEFDGSDGQKKWLVKADNFTFTTGSVVPCTAITFNNTAISLGDGNTNLAILPMGAGVKLDSSHMVFIEKQLDNGTWQQVPEGYINSSVITGNVPVSLWGLTKTITPSADTIGNVPTGLKLAPSPTEYYQLPVSGSIDLKTFKDEPIGLKFSWGNILPTKRQQYPQDKAMNILRHSIMDKEKVIPFRKNILDVLKTNGICDTSDVSLDITASSANNLLVAPPILINLGAELS